MQVRKATLSVIDARECCKTHMRQKLGFPFFDIISIAANSYFFIGREGSIAAFYWKQLQVYIYNRVWTALKAVRQKLKAPYHIYLHIYIWWTLG